MSTANQKPRVSVVVTTRNEERNLALCLRSVQSQTYPPELIETVVVDNQSTDRTVAIAREFTDRVFDRGPERSAQRNFGILEASEGRFVLYLDADMILAPSTIALGVDAMLARGLVGAYVPEVVLGTSFLAQIRRFERSFYDGTVIDCARLLDRQAFAACGGFDRELVGPEDWDLDRRLRQRGPVELVAGYDYRALDRFVTRHRPEQLAEACRLQGLRAPVLFHNESEQRLSRYLRKKLAYSPSCEAYARKWGARDPEVRRQLGFAYRFLGVFLENGKWRRLARHPLLTLGMYALRICVGAVYVSRRRR